MSKDLIWIHIMKEEYEALPSSIEYHPEDAQMVTGIRKPTSIPAHLRHPWLHQKFTQHPLHAVTDSTWMPSDNRLMTSTPEGCFLIAVRPSGWNTANGIRNVVLNSWSRHDIGHCIQVIKDAYHFDPEEQSSMRIFNIKGNIFKAIFENLDWQRGILWDYHVPFRASCLATEASRRLFAASIRDAVSHAGLMIMQSSLPDVYKSQLTNGCIQLGISMAAPKHTIGQVYSGHQDHASYVIELHGENIDPSTNHSTPCVPSHQTRSEGGKASTDIIMAPSQSPSKWSHASGETAMIDITI